MKPEGPLNTVMKLVDFLIYYNGSRVICLKIMSWLCSKASSGGPSHSKKSHIFPGPSPPQHIPTLFCSLSNFFFYCLHLVHSTTHVIFLLFLQNLNLLLITGPLHLLSPLPGMFLPPDIYRVTPSIPLLKCHLINETFFDHPS